ncbi:MAG: FimV/HubP family polar landmark protein, partial [Conchiformibius sp.]|nr:FimV/HubP family polar landmark protein [Conchiformibius sp.]
AEDDLDLSGLDGLGDLDFGLPKSEAAAPKKQSAAAEDDLDLSGLDGLGDLDFGLPKSEAAAPKKQSAASEDDLDLSGLDGLGDLDFGLPKSEAAAPKKSPAQAVIDDLGLDGLGDLDFGLPKAEVASPQESLAATPDVVSTKSPAQAVIDDLGLDGLEDLDFGLPKPEAVMPKQSSAVADDDLNLSNLDELESLDFNSSVSEQVQAGHSDSDGLGALDFDPFKLEASEHHADAMELADAESLRLPESNGLELKEVASISSGLSEADDTALMMPELQDGGLSWEQHPAVAGDDKDSGLVFSSMEEVNQAETLDNHLAVSDTFDTLDMPTESLSMADDAWLGDLDESMAFADLPEPESGGESVSLGELADLESFDASDWDDDMLASDGSVGFVSGAVGMEEPQEAKLDLARMYLDIEDEAAARDTLTELVAEASGEVLEEAKRLLADLG